MERIRRRPLLIAVLIAMTFVHAEKARSSIDAAGLQARVAIAGLDHAILKDYLHRSGSRSNQPLDSAIKSVLLRNAPESYSKGCDGSTGRWESAPNGRGSSDVRLIFSEGRREDGSVRALLVYGCSADGKDSGGNDSDERLASIILDKDRSRISAVPIEAGGNSHLGRVRIRLERELRIGGKSIIGLRIASSGGEPDPASPVVQEEKIEFFLLDEQDVLPAGSVLKAREDVPTASSGVIRTYEAALVLKKDMIGNITGILSPYVIKDNGKTSRKGMFRFNWDAIKGAFVQE